MKQLLNYILDVCVVICTAVLHKKCLKKSDGKKVISVYFLLKFEALLPNLRQQYSTL